VFGKNKVLKQVASDGQTLWVQEVFDTIQGEGPLAGVPAIFVRLAGCNLKCYFCDTDFESSTWEPTLDELVACINKYRPTRPPEAFQQQGRPLVVLTGGEPLRQNVVPLIYRLNREGYAVQIETAGTLTLLDLAYQRQRGFVSLVVSPKTGKVNPEIGAIASAWKYIISAGQPVDDADGLPLWSTQVVGKGARIARPLNWAPVFLQPMDEGDAALNKANMTYTAELCMRYGYRLSVQQHKVVGLP
jgi:organic radical activating enzyme